MIGRLFPGGSGRLRRVSAPRPKPVFAGDGADESAAEPVFGAEPATAAAPGDGESRPSRNPRPTPFDADVPGIEIEVTPAGKATKRLSLLSGGEKSLVALAFMFAVFLARPCPFYILDEVEAALDDSNIDRFLQLVGAYSDRSQFIVITHQRRTMEAADVLYGVSMGGDGVSKVVSRKLDRRAGARRSRGPQRLRWSRSCTGAHGAPPRGGADLRRRPGHAARARCSTCSAATARGRRSSWSGTRSQRDPELARAVMARRPRGRLALDAPPRPRRRSTPDEAVADMLAGAEAIADVLGFEPRLYRAPYGHFVPATVAEAERRGWTCVHWSALGEDWDESATAARSRTASCPTSSRARSCCCTTPAARSR